MDYSSLLNMSQQIHLDLVKVFWALLPLIVVVLIVLEFLKSDSEAGAVGEILRRTLVAILLLYSFEMVTDMIASVGDGILLKLDAYNDSWAVLKRMGEKISSGSTSVFDIKANVMFVLAIVSYMIAYLGFFMAEALTHFVWVVLYIASPLMILAYVPRKTSFVTTALYTGLCKVVVWKILWLILGALLLKFAEISEFEGTEEYLTLIVVNLCIGFSMLFVPIATRSFLTSGMETAASSMGSIPLSAVSAAIRVKTGAVASKVVKSSGGAVKAAVRRTVRPTVSSRNLKDASSANVSPSARSNQSSRYANTEAKSHGAKPGQSMKIDNKQKT